MKNTAQKLMGLFPEKVENVLSVQELIRFVRKHSPFYKSLYKDLPDVVRLKDLPVTAQEDFWAANALPKGSVITEPLSDGLLFSSGGTTGDPKFTFFSVQEWETITSAFAHSNSHGYLESGDRIANIFYVGRMYASFIFTTLFLQKSSLDLVQFPIAGHTEYSLTLKIMKDFGANVIVGVPFSLINLTEYINKNPGFFDGKQIQKIFYAGEPMFEDQQDFIKNVFPNAQIYSIGYSCADAGIVGYFDKTCALGEHRVYGSHIVMEIVDEVTGEVIEEVGREGLIVITSLYRKVMPIVKYAVGDRGVWTEPKGHPDRKFRLLGRSGEAARIATVKIFISDLKKMLQPYYETLKILDFQVVLDHRQEKDFLVLKIASPLPAVILDSHSSNIKMLFEQENPLYLELIKHAILHPMEIHWIKSDGLEMNMRTGKMLRVIDKRPERSARKK